MPASKRRADRLPVENVTNHTGAEIDGRQAADAGHAIRPRFKVPLTTSFAENAASGNEHLGHGHEGAEQAFATDALPARIRYIIEER